MGQNTMGRLAADRRSSTAREQSLLRSFSAIPRPSTDDATGNSTGRNDGSRDHLERLRGFRRCSKTDRRKRILQGDRRGCQNPTGIAPDPAKKVVVPLYDTAAPMYHKGPNGIAVAPPISSVDLSALPFTESSVDKRGQHKGFRKDYDIGDTLRSPSHMNVEPIDGQAFQAVNSLDKYDFAFVKRSNGSFSYAVLAFRSMGPVRGKKELIEECMTFVMSGIGSTKTVSKRHWGKCVRLVSMDGLVDHPPVGMISFDRQTDDECSMISNVSDRARSSRWRKL